MADEEDGKEYRWEGGYEKTWEAIREDEDGLLDGAIAEIIQKSKRKRQQNKSNSNRLGMMRHLYVILDCSESMSLQDVKPTRLFCSIKLLEIFIEEFFDQNPISQLGLIALRAKRAEKLTNLTANSKIHIAALQKLHKVNLTGEPSLQNGLQLAQSSLKGVPSHASREVLIIMGSLTTCDPIDLAINIETLKSDAIRCSVISLSAEIRICRVLTQETNGIYSAVLDDVHFRDQLLAHIDPPSAITTQENSLIRMGFPHPKSDEGKDPPLTMCMCHIGNNDEPSKLSTGGYHCPQCFSKYCELPVECKSCLLTLVSAPHLARSYHHLFPVHRFDEIEFQKQSQHCYGCQKIFQEVVDKYIYQCSICLQYYCMDCDVFIHETLHTCVGCTTIPSVVLESFRNRSVPPISTHQ